MKRIYTLMVAVLIVANLSAQLRVVSVNPTTNDIIIKNYGNMDLDISMYRLCSLFDYEDLNQAQVSIVDGDFMLSENEEVTINWAAGSGMAEAGADLALYIPGGMFSNPNDMVDFVQWGSAGNGRESEAQTAGLWTVGDFISGDAPYNYTGDGTQNGVDLWSATVAQETTIVINELDADQAGTDALEFVELFGTANESLDGMVLVHYNGSNNESYAAYDLDGYTLNENGFFVIGNDGVENNDYILPSNGLQNGADAVALYFGSDSDFPGNTAVTTDNLIDAIVYGTNDSDDMELLVLLNAGQPQVEEDTNGAKDTESNARIPDGGTQRNTDTYVQQLPTPGCPNETGCPMTTDPTISFSVETQDVAEGNMVEVTVTMINSDAAYTAEVSLDGGTATMVDDFDNVFPMALNFADGVNDSQSFSFLIVDDTEVEGTETIELGLSSADMGLSLDIIAQVITIDASDVAIPVYDIVDVVQLNAEGVVDSLGLECEIRGVVYGVNMRPSGLQFTLIDPTDGIGVFSFDENFGYTVTEGDSLHIVGTIAQFNGLTQISPSSVYMPSSGNDLMDAVEVCTLDEFSESNLVYFPCVYIVDTADWGGGSSGFNADFTDGINVFTMRVDSDVDLYDAEVPMGMFSLTGIGGQYDSSSPYDSGYQLFPRYISDIGEADCSAQDLPTASYSVSSQSVEEGDLVTVTVNMINSEAAYQVDVILQGGTATVGDDFDDVFTTYLDFPEGSNEPQSMTFMITDDMDIEGEETIELFLMTCEFGLMIGQDTQTITIAASDQVFPVIDIADVVTLNAEGVADSLDVECELRGVVYGVNMRPGGLQFTLIDPTDGIGVFSFDEDFGYTVMEGDSIHIVGTIDQYNGLTQISPSSVEFISADNDLQAPALVTTLDEFSESNLVSIACVSIVNPAEWTNEGSGFNVDVTDGTNTYAMRIDADVDIYGTDAPVGVFTLTGIGGQFDSSSPYDDGYQILPRYASDITTPTTASFTHETVSGGGGEQDIDVDFSYTGNGGTDFAWEFGDTETSDEQDPTHTFAWDFVETAGFTTTATLTVTDENGCSISMSVSDVDLAWEGIEELNASSFNFYPNPTTTNLNIEGESIIDEVRIYDLVGQLVVSENIASSIVQLNVSNLVAGVYFLTIVTEGQEVTKRFVKE